MEFDGAAVLHELVASTGPIGAFVWWVVSRVRGYLENEFGQIHAELGALKSEVDALRMRDEDLSRRIGRLEIRADTGPQPVAG